MNDKSRMYVNSIAKDSFVIDSKFFHFHFSKTEHRLHTGSKSTHVANFSLLVVKWTARVYQHPLYIPFAVRGCPHQRGVVAVIHRTHIGACGRLCAPHKPNSV